MAGTVTVAYSRQRGLQEVTWTWTSDASGDVSGTDTQPVTGEIVRVVTNPSATAPSDNYDLVINDADGVDVLAGAGQNRDTATSEQSVPIIETLVGANPYGERVFVDGVLSLVVSNAGNAKSGVVTMYLK